MEQTKKLALGILAHVDARKTTLAEGILSVRRTRKLLKNLKPHSPKRKS
ncbi:hypothetical protein ACTNEY_13635 [Fusicatenibacter saccharivorans]